MVKVLQGFDIQKLYVRTGKRKYKINLIPDSYFIEHNEQYQKLYKQLSEEMEKSIVKIGDTEIKTSYYIQYEERRNNLIEKECFELKWQLEHFNEEVILKKFYIIEVDDEDCSDNDLLD